MFPFTHLFTCILAYFIALTQSTLASSTASDPSSKHNHNDTYSTRPYSTWMADSIISRGQGIATPTTSDSSIFLQIGLFQTALLRLLQSPATHDHATENYQLWLKKGTESIVGRVLNATQDTRFPLDRLSLGRGLLAQYGHSRNGTDRAALDALRESIDLQPKNAFGGYWYYIYPNWSYLDGMFSLAPFYALYTSHFNHTDTTHVTADTIIHQLDLLWNHCHNNTTGLLVHGYDASKAAVWADSVTGASPIVWGRALGWYTMALIDLLELETVFPRSSPQGQHLQSRFVSLANAIVTAVDTTSGAWWQVLSSSSSSSSLSYPVDETTRSGAGNYIESSASAMFTYALYKGVRLGLLTPAEKYTVVANRAYQYLVENFVVHDSPTENGTGKDTLSYNGTVSVCSLNSTANYEYYIGQPLLYNSVLGSASFVLASLEHEVYVSDRSWPGLNSTRLNNG